MLLTVVRKDWLNKSHSNGADDGNLHIETQLDTTTPGKTPFFPT